MDKEKEITKEKNCLLRFAHCEKLSFWILKSELKLSDRATEGHCRSEKHFSGITNENCHLRDALISCSPDRPPFAFRSEAGTWGHNTGDVLISTKRNFLCFQSGLTSHLPPVVIVDVPPTPTNTEAGWLRGLTLISVLVGSWQKGDLSQMRRMLKLSSHRSRPSSAVVVVSTRRSASSFVFSIRLRVCPEVLFILGSANFPS